MIGFPVRKYLDEEQPNYFKMEEMEDKVRKTRELFHKIWTSQVGTEGYNKREWQKLQKLLGELGVEV
jgi:hypothetical protein